MATASVLTAAGMLALVCGLQQAASTLVRSNARADGAPSRQLVIASASVDLLAAAGLLAIAWLAPNQLVVFGRWWRHDIWSALLWGGLAGSFFHLVGSGSPLPLASVQPPGRSAGALSLDRTELGTLAIFLASEFATSIVWFGVGLPTLAQSLPRLLAMALIATGYGLRRRAAGQDHVLLGAIDGLLLAVLYFLTGSIVAVVVCRFVADLLAYVAAVSKADERALEPESGAP